MAGLASLFAWMKKVQRLNRDERSFILVAWMLALPADLCLRSVGFGRTSRWVARVPEVGFAPLSVERAEQLVATAFRFSPARSGCLPRSIVQFALQRAAGSDVALVIGVRRPGRTGEGDAFAGHAWVEARKGDGGHRDAEHAVIFELAPDRP